MIFKCLSCDEHLSTFFFCINLFSKEFHYYENLKSSDFFSSPFLLFLFPSSYFPESAVILISVILFSAMFSYLLWAVVFFLLQLSLKSRANDVYPSVFSVYETILHLWTQWSVIHVSPLTSHVSPLTSDLLKWFEMSPIVAWFDVNVLCFWHRHDRSY